MEIARTVAELRARVAEWRRDGLKVAVVPTMGSLHNGHLSLIGNGLANADRVIATLFVNPTQFAAGEDLSAYPRDEADDAGKLRSAGCNLLFAPDVQEMYPSGFSTRVIVDGLTDCLCGAARAGHFDGVAQVVTKLLNQAGADVAVFGEKDWQQLAVVRRLAFDLDIPTSIIGAETIREPDGLAMSSRNRYLDAEERRVASALPRLMQRTVAQILAGVACVDACESASVDLIACGFRSVDYLEVRTADALDLVATELPPESCRLFAAAHLGRARLIDNIDVCA